MLSAKSFLASSRNWRRQSECSRATARARGQNAGLRARRQKRLLQRNQVDAGAPQRENRLASIAARQASAIKSLPWRLARRSRKSPPHARGFARTISASPLPDTSGRAESRSAMGSSTRRTRQEPSSAQQSDAAIGRPLPLKITIRKPDG